MRSLIALVLLSSLAPAQAQRRPVIRATADASASGAPDQVKVSVGVLTRAATAQDAAAQNAALTSTVIAQLKQAAGSGSEVKTISYSLSPNYNYPPGGQPILVGYSASNTVEVTTSDLNAAGKIIDTGIQAGANTVNGLSFGMKDPQPMQAQALRLAAQKAKANAEAIASGLGVRIGAVMIAEQGSSIRVVNTDVRAGAAPSPTTPVEPGLVVVSATVSVEVELVP